MSDPNPNPEIPIPPIRTKPKPNPTNTTTTTSTTPRVTISTPTASGSGLDTPTSGAERKIAIAVDFSNESSYAVQWAVHHYIRPGDAVILLHVQPTSVLYGADWGSLDFHHDDFLSDSNNNNNNNNINNNGGGDDEDNRKKLEHHFDAFTSSKASDLAQPLIDAHVPYKIHIVKDHDMRERLCLEVERLGLHAVIMGSRGFGATKRGSDGRLGSVSDYCVRHCVCPVVVVRYPGDNNGDGDDTAMVSVAEVDEEGATEEDEEYHDVPDEQKATA